MVRFTHGLVMVVGCMVSAGLNADSSATTANSMTNALHLDWIDKSVSPADDFFKYANGTWQKQNPIPPQYSSWGSFYILHEQVQKVIHQLLIEASGDKNAKPGSITQKVGDFYFSGMDEATINKLGIAPLKPDFDLIQSIKTKDDLQEVMTYLQQIGVGVGFNFGSMQDFKNSDEMIGAAMQGGLSLPDRDYYLKDDPKFKKIRAAYVAHVNQMFQLLGDEPTVAANEAGVVMAMETALAEASMTQAAQRDPHAIYHMMTLKELEETTPHFSWSRYFETLKLSTIQHINLGMPSFFKALDGMLQTRSLDDWKIYLRWHLLSGYASYLSTPFVDQNFKMASQLSGTKRLLPRWQRVVDTENGALGFAIGKLYVERYFSPASKKEVLAILHSIRQVLSNDLQTLGWMAPETRQAALKKLEAMGERVGYPTKWWDYTSLLVNRGPYVLNVKRANAFLMRRDYNKIGKPIDKTEWAMTPQTVNAYYDPSMNNINIPAGILQPPFFDPKAPAAINYGGIGFVIGHEITHGFDDEGAQFDGQGNLKNWWTSDDLKKFKTATQCIMEQFSHYKVNGDLPVQGPLVMGEATADLGGVILAYRAFHESNAYKTAKPISGFTPDQLFFLSVAHVWAANVRPEQMRHLVTVDPHPPMMFRVNGTLANIPAFHEAFSIPKTSVMVNKKQCVIW